MTFSSAGEKEACDSKNNSLTVFIHGEKLTYYIPVDLLEVLNKGHWQMTYAITLKYCTKVQLFALLEVSTQLP